MGAHRPGAPVARDKHLSAAPARLPVEGSRGRHQALVVEAPLRPPSCERCLALPGSEATSDISGTGSQMSTETQTEVQATTGMDSGRRLRGGGHKAVTNQAHNPGAMADTDSHSWRNGERQGGQTQPCEHGGGGRTEPSPVMGSHGLVAHSPLTRYLYCPAPRQRPQPCPRNSTQASFGAPAHPPTTSVHRVQTSSTRPNAAHGSARALLCNLLNTLSGSPSPC